MDERLKQAYLEGLRQAHHGARVEVHIGIGVLAHLRTLSYNRTPLGCRVTVGDLPIKVRDSFPPDHIEIHTVTTIPA